MSPETRALRVDKAVIKPHVRYCSIKDGGNGLSSVQVYTGDSIVALTKENGAKLPLGNIQTEARLIEKSFTSLQKQFIYSTSA